MMYVDLNGQHIAVTKADVSWGQNIANDFSVSIPAREIDWSDVLLKDVVLWHRGKKIISGFVNEPAQLELPDNQVLVAKLECLDDLGRLTCKRALTDSHYQNIQVSIILQDLLQSTTDWTLTDTSTMIDPLAVTTVDLRNKEHLWAQIIEVVKSIPRCFVRYGGYNTLLGKHELHIGNFDNERTNVVQNQNLVDLSLQRGSQSSYTTIEAYGDRSASKRVTLEDALLFPATTSHPDYPTYPISLDPLTGTYVCQDLTPGKRGCEITKTFSVHKTQNNAPPTTTQIRQTGFAIWQKCVRFFQQNSTTDTYTVKAFLPESPLVCDRTWIQGSVSEMIYDHVAQCMRWTETFSIAESLRITKVSTNLQTNAQSPGDCPEDWVLYSLEVTNSDYANEDDSDMQLFDSLERFDAADDVAASIGILLQTVVAVTHTTLEPADGACTPGTAKQYVFPLPAPPAGSTSVFYNILTNPSTSAGVTYTVFQEPALPGTNLILCVKYGGGWPGVGNVSVSVQYTFN